MTILISIASILSITLLVFWVNRLKLVPITVCPVCAGVSGTWLWMLAAYYLQFSLPEWVLTMLMGGSVVGIAYTLEKKIPSGKSLLLWKTLFIPAGFATVYGIVFVQWKALIPAVLAIGFTVLYFFSRDGKNNKKVDYLEEKLKDCCGQ